MAEATTFCYSDETGLGEERQSSEVEELRRRIRELTAPKRSLYTTPPGLRGFLDFSVCDDSVIEMEIMEGYDNDFANVDIPTAERVIEVAMTDTRSIPLRQKLESLKMDWL